MTIGIYCITEIETGKVYIGQSVDIEKRWRTHQKARPITQFHYRIVHQLLDVDVKALDALERLYINMLDSLTPNGLNRTKGGWGKFGHNDAETRAKISAAKMGNQNTKGRTLSPEHRAKLSEAHKGMTFSPEHRAKLSAAKMGRTPPNKGKPMSSAQRVKMSESIRLRNTHKES